MGQKNNALQTLHDTITNKRQQRNWTKALEQVRGRAPAAGGRQGSGGGVLPPAAARLCRSGAGAPARLQWCLMAPMVAPTSLPAGSHQLGS